MDRKRVQEILNQFSGKTTLIVGDLMLDEFIWGKVARISPEAPVPIVEVVNETYRLGGAGNVAANIHEFGGKAIPIGVIGKDETGNRVQEILKQLGIEGFAVARDDRPTTLKTRIIAHNQQLVRADWESRQPLSPQLNLALSTAFTRYLPQANAVIISDYAKGVVNRELLSTILPKAKAANVPVFLDPKVYDADYYRPITAITPNQREAELLTGIAIIDQATLEDAGQSLLEKFECDYALITCGEEGMALFERSVSHHLPTVPRKVFDVSGAGDTVIATLALVRAAGATMEEAATLANHAAGIAVGKVGTATVTREELLADFESRNAHSAG
jgi:D-glycero-beta-D-manno-heptose-7-phosphate kinase